MIVDSQSILIEVYHREKGRRTFSTYGPGDEVQVESLGVQFSVRDAYERTSLMRRHKNERER